MTDQQTLPPRSGTSFADQPHAYDPVAQPQLFDGVIGKRSLAFIVDAIIIASHGGCLCRGGLLGIVTLGLGLAALRPRRFPCRPWL